MSLADDIRTLRGETIAHLNAAHDYYMETQVAWDIVQTTVKAGKRFRIRNEATGTWIVDEDLAAKARGYVAEQLAEATFQQFISIFEHFFLNLLRLWLAAHPRSLGRKSVDFEAILEAPDKEAIVLIAVEGEVNELLYKRPRDWFAYLEGKVKLGRPSEDEVARFAEAKATRDVLVHNRGVANATYEAKAGKLARYAVGERIDVPGPYHRETWELIRGVVADVSDAAVAKAG